LSPPSARTASSSSSRSIRCRRWRAGAACGCSATRTAAVSDVATFKGADGLTWIDSAGRSFTLTLKELAAWRGNRGDAGRVRPDRFLTDNKFGRKPENGRNGNGEGR
jgi:hypothetical protein